MAVRRKTGRLRKKEKREEDRGGGEEKGRKREEGKGREGEPERGKRSTVRTKASNKQRIAAYFFLI